LLFMLAATTASIVVFRWIWQENFSSGARLKASEAYQASQAGLEATQSWLANKGADAGALIRVFEDASLNPGKGPVLLNSNGANDPDLLAGTIFKDNNNRQQEFKVYLTGVNTEAQPYKLKFLSEGTARDGSKHRQVAIFEVAGLYKMSVNIPGDPSPPRDVPALFIGGGTVDYGGTNTVSSAYINGDWEGNPPRTVGDFVVTGNAKLSGDNIYANGNTCVGKDVNMQNQREGFGLKDVYVGGNCDNAGGSFENLFVEGNLTQTQNIKMSKNLTVNGDIMTSLNGYTFEVERNLVMGNTGRLIFNGDGKIFSVKDSVWIPNASGIPNMNNPQNNPGRRILGSTSNSLLAVQNLTPPNCTTNCHQQNSNAIFSTNAINKLTNLNNNTNKPLGADSAKIYCDGIWHSVTGCDGEPTFMVDDIIKTALLEMLEAKAANSNCNLGNPFVLSANNKWDPAVQTLNNCYRSLKNNQAALYNDFLVVKMKQDGDAAIESNPILDGKFILIFDEKTGGNQFMLPAMTSNSKVFVYLKKGVGGMIMPGNGNCTSGQIRNYFIYVLEGFGQINGFTTDCPINGTVYMPVFKPNGELNCDNFNSTLKIQSTANIIQNADLLEELFQSGVICDYKKEGDCEQGGSLDNPGQTTGGGTKITDVSYVPAVPHLKVTLQSQYASEEGLGSVEPVPARPAILVMPRIIYAQQGEINNTTELAQRYNVLYLNGAQKPSNPNLPPPVCINGGCTPSTKGVYTYYLEVTGNGCTSSNALCRNSFYVVVSDGTSSASGSSSSSGGSGDGGTSVGIVSSSSAAVPSSSSLVGNNSCAYQPGWCGNNNNYQTSAEVPLASANIQNGQMNNNSVGGKCFFVKSITSGSTNNMKLTINNIAVGNTNGSACYGNNGSGFNFSANGCQAYLETIKKDDGYYILFTGNDGNVGFTFGSPSCGGDTPPVPSSSSAPSSSSSVTATCVVAKSSVTQGENIGPPTISCSSGQLNKANATFNATSGALPTDFNNWKTNGNAYYGGTVTGTQTITVSNIVCGSTTLNNIPCESSITVSRPTCSGVSGTVTVGQTITPTVSCGNAAPGNRTFTVSSGTWNASGNGGSFANASTGTTPRQIYLNTVYCDNHNITVTASTVGCGGVIVNAAPSSSSSKPASSSSRPSSSSLVLSSSSAGGSTCVGQANLANYCPGIAWGDIIWNTKPSVNQSTNKCYYVQGINGMKYRGGTIRINGSIKVCDGSSDDCKDANGGLPAPQDGGYYIYVPTQINTDYWSDFNLGTKPACAGTGGGTSSSSSAGGGGGGNSITITGGGSGSGTNIPAPSGNGQVTYTITCTNTNQSLDCNRGQNDLLRFSVDGGSWVTQGSNNSPVKVMNPCVNGAQLTIDFNGNGTAVICNNRNTYW